MQATSISPSDPQDFTVLPYNGTVFTASLPRSARGGAGSDLILNPIGSIFRGYNGHIILGKSDLYQDTESIRRLGPGDLCRVVVWDEGLETAHPVTERNWYSAKLLRPLQLRVPDTESEPAFTRDITSQILVHPQDFEVLTGVAISRHLTEGNQESPNIFSEVIRNDLLHLQTLSKGVLERTYKVLNGTKMEE